MTGGLALILGSTGRNLGAGMSGGTAYVYELTHERVNRESLASVELLLEPLGIGHVAIVTGLLERHIADTGSTLAKRMLEGGEATMELFVKVVPRDYAAVLEAREAAINEGLDPDGDVVWSRIMEVTGG